MLKVTENLNTTLNFKHSTFQTPGLSKKEFKIKEAARRWDENLFETDRKGG